MRGYARLNKSMTGVELRRCDKLLFGFLLPRRL